MPALNLFIVKSRSARSALLRATSSFNALKTEALFTLPHRLYGGHGKVLSSECVCYLLMGKQEFANKI